MVLAFFALALLAGVVVLVTKTTESAVVPPAPLSPLTAAKTKVAAAVAAAEVEVAERVAAYATASAATRRAAGSRLDAALRNLAEVRRAAEELDRL